jgi:DNA-directed RNA polymerase subunit E"
MSKKKVCRTCKMFVDGNDCPVCHSQNFATSWQGRIFIVDPEKSEIAKKIGLAQKGEYAIKAR